MDQNLEDETRLLERLRRIRMEGRIEGAQVQLPRDLLGDLFMTVFGQAVDEDWYLERYPDVADAVARGVLGSGAEHYVQAGIYEGRMPYRVALDNAEYLDSHPDVLASIREGAFRSALDHFVQVGFGEGRAFTLASPEATEP
ncbi:hypothetical protein [Marinibacterium sp. SX1]|uniref:hypothetical protein n=1 Tax=Marinibacterium sp. SX1 TaxID=3388424 RepID=UPI003D16C040